MPRIAAKPAFTLLELLLVITIIGILVSVLILDFAGVRERQALYLAGDQFVVLMQQARAEVGSGKVKTQAAADGSEETVFACQGAFLKKGELPLWVTMDYDVVSGSCDFSSEETENYGFVDENVSLGSMEVGGAELSSFYALYVPPRGELIFHESSEAGQSYAALSGDALIELTHGSMPEPLSFELSAETGALTLLLDEIE